MHEMELANCRLDFTLKAVTPLLIGGAPRALARGGGGHEGGKARSASDYDGVRWVDSGANSEQLITVSLHRFDRSDGPHSFYIPGSSLRGVFRHYLARTIQQALEASGRADRNTGPEEDQTSPPEEPASVDNGNDSGPFAVRQVFGTTARRGHLVFRDAIANPSPAGSDSTYSGSPVRPQETSLGGILRFVTQNQLDRVTQASTSGLRTMAPLEAGTTFTGSIEIRNFSWWVVGAVLHCLEALDRGRLSIGSKGSIGFGKVSVEYPNPALRLRYHRAVPEAAFAGPSLPGHGAIAAAMHSGGNTTAGLWWADEKDFLGIEQGMRDRPDIAIERPFHGRSVQLEMTPGRKRWAMEELKRALEAMTSGKGS